MSTLQFAIREALCEHETDWRYEWGANAGGRPWGSSAARMVMFCSCGVEGFDYDEDHMAAVAIEATIKWLEANEPDTDADYMSEDPELCEWADGFRSGTDAVISTVRNSLTQAHDSAKVSS